MLAAGESIADDYEDVSTTVRYLINERDDIRDLVSAESISAATSDNASISSSELGLTAVLDEGSHPLSHEKSQIVELLIARHDAYRTQNGQSSNTNTSGPSGADQGSNKGKEVSSGKKRASEADDDNGGDGNGSDGSEGKPPKKLKSAVEADEARKYFACPFFKKDPVKYSDCHRYRLLRIRDVKQHLRRCHCRLIYCPVCDETFQKEEDRDTHTRQRTCQEVPFRIDGMTKLQQEKLAEKIWIKTSEDTQWFKMFTTVFPDEQPPSSPYIEPDPV